MEKELLRIGAAYIRVSDERQDEYSPTSQSKRIKEYAEKEGYIIPDEYIFYDDGISGRTVNKRDEFKRMISIAIDKNHPFDKIYVWKFSRFARNQEEAIVYKSLLAKHKVSVVSVSEALPDGPFGSLIERIIEWEDEFYSSRLSEEVQRGFAEKISRGEPVVPPPFGYIMREGRYYPDIESGKAEIVKEVFALYANGAKQREIAVMLGKRGVRTRYGNVPDNRFVDYVLHNSTYIGKIRYSEDGSRAISQRKHQDGKIKEVDGIHEPLISMELWNKVQSMLEIQKKAYPKYAKRQQTVDYMLKGLLRCSSCGGTLACTGASGKSQTRCVQCCNYARGSCHTSHSITLPRIEYAFLNGLKQALADKTFTISPQRQINTPQADINFDKLIEIEERKLVRAKEAYLSGIDTIEQYAQNKTEAVERIEHLKARRDAVEVVEIDVNSFATKVAEVVDFIQRTDVTASAKNEALHHIIDKIVYDKANENLAIFFHDF